MTRCEYTSVVYIECDEDSADAADRFLEKNVGEFDSEVPLWGSALCDEFDLCAFTNAKGACAKIVFRHPNDCNKFLVWCTFSNVTVHSVFRISDPDEF